jgi:hypothetical protein
VVGTSWAASGVAAAASRRQHQAEQAADAGQHQAFGEQLADQPFAAGTEGAAQRQLLLAAEGTRHQKARQVDAGDQQQR